MKKISALILLVTCMLLSGCWDKQEIEDNTFAILLGIDNAEGKDIIVTIAYPLTQTEGSGPNEGTDGGNYSVMSVKAPSVVEGLNMFSTKLSGPLALHTVKAIVISREIAQGDMLRQVFSSWRYEEIRNTTNVLISESKAVEFIEARVKESPIDPLRQEELLLEQANGSAYYKPIQLLELLSNLKSDGGDGVAMYGGIAAESDSASREQADSEEKSGMDIDEVVREGYLPGEIPISADNINQISGLAVFRGANMVGVLNSLEAQSYSMLAQDRAKKILTLPDPLSPGNNIVAEILPAGKNKISSAINNGIPTFNIGISLKCTVECIQSGIDYSIPENYNILTQHIQSICAENMSKLIAKTQREYNADILKLGDKLAYHFSSAGEWEEFNWAEKYAAAQISLNANLKIERTGIMMP